MITNVVVGTQLALIRKSRRDQEVQARRNLPGVAPLEEHLEEETNPKDMVIDPDTARAEQADLAMAQQQEQQPTDAELDEHATRLAAQVPGMLGHIPFRRPELPTTMLEAFLEECLMNGEGDGEDEKRGK